MKTFFDWACENKLELPVNDRVEPEATDTPEGEDTKDEQRCRTGWSANYPPAYFSAQYPQKYVNPRKSTADLDAEQMGKKKK
jgi:hypothetical protein